MLKWQTIFLLDQKLLSGTHVETPHFCQVGIKLILFCILICLNQNTECNLKQIDPLPNENTLHESV